MNMERKLASPAPAEPTDWANFEPGGVSGVTLMQAHFTHYAFERHSHPEYGIGLTYSGIQTFNCRGTMQTSGPEHVIFLNPDQAHDGLRGPAGGYSYGMLYIDEDVMLTVRERAAGTLGSTCFRDTVVHDAQAALLLHNAIKAVGQSQESLRAESLMLNAFIKLLLRYGEISRAALAPLGAGQRRLLRVRDYLRSNASRDVSLKELALEANVSRVYLSRAFERYFGAPPHVYLNSIRLARAKQLLLAGVSLADAAAIAGFADQSHFNRRFKGATGLSPGVWLSQMRLK
jgi:AraC-like DNA-binding protein